MMIKSLFARLFGTTVLVVSVTACMSSPGASAGDVLAESISLTQCPLRTAEPVLQVFGEQDWAGHVEAADEQAGALGQWRIDFARQTVVLVTLGEKPSLGYGISIRPPVRRSADKLALQVERQAPAEGMMSAMALSTPCTYVLLDSVDFNELVVSDADSGEVLHTWQRQRAGRPSR